MVTDQGMRDAIPAAGPERGAAAPGPAEQPRTVRAVFADAADGYAAVGGLRAAGFPIDLAGSIEGDLIVSIQAARSRMDELATLIAAHQGRLEA